MVNGFTFEFLQRFLSRYIFLFFVSVFTIIVLDFYFIIIFFSIVCDFTLNIYNYAERAVESQPKVPERGHLIS